MSINHIAKFTRGVVRASVSGCTDAIVSRSAGWNATRPLAVAVAAAALVTGGETPALAQFVLFGFGQQPTVQQPRVVHVRKHVAHQHGQPATSKQAAKTSDCLALATSDSKSQKAVDGQLANPDESITSDKTSSGQKKKRADRASKRHARGHRGRSADVKLASARPDCPKTASLDSEPQRIATVEPGDATESAASHGTSPADTKRNAAHRRKRDADGHRGRSSSKKGKIKNPDAEPQKTANVEQIDSVELASAHEASTGKKKRHAAHERKHKHHPRRLASSGKGAVKTTSCPGLARFLSAVSETAQGPQIDLVETKQRVADARQGVVSDASGSVTSNDATEPTCSGVVASFYSDAQKTANGEEFDPTELTAAHRSLPFGTKLRVTNLATGQSVAVRINDRGPYIEGREIDLSEQAAASVGMLKHGVAKVKLDVVQELTCVSTDTGGGSWGGQSAFRLGGSESALAFFQDQ
ncbi:MAG: septal ring lytic transglycosylase RlpA family protein [Xanthobacteraceae bacterium]|nr:septal ring lytic transglycosylase RlpA family protein [Xanthobacteraceae bacterium]